MSGEFSLVVFGCYRVTTSAGRVLDLMYRGRPRSSKRLWFTELDPPYGDVFLRIGQIKSAAQIGPHRV